MVIEGEVVLRLPSCQVTQYHRMSEVWVVGAVQWIVMVWSPILLASIGPTIPGSASGVAGFETGLQGPSPTALWARTLNVYAVPLVSPVMSHDVLLQRWVFPPRACTS